MIKALLIVTAMSNGGFDYKTEMPSMESCMEARTVVEKQNSEVKTLYLVVQVYFQDHPYRNK